MSTFGKRASGARLERMEASPRFADGAFRNTRPVAPGLKKGTVTPTMAEFLCGGQRRTPPGPLPWWRVLGAEEAAPQPEEESKPLPAEMGWPID